MQCTFCTRVEPAVSSIYAQGRSHAGGGGGQWERSSYAPGSIGGPEKVPVIAFYLSSGAGPGITVSPPLLAFTSFSCICRPILSKPHSREVCPHQRFCFHLYFPECRLESKSHFTILAAPSILCLKDISLQVKSFYLPSFILYTSRLILEM